jgi:hypothetical protein
MVYPAGPLHRLQDHFEQNTAPTPDFEKNVLRPEL